MAALEAALAYARDQHEALLAQYKQLLAIPSVSTLPEHRDDVRRAAQWLADALEGLGMQQVEVIATSGHPIVYGERLQAPGKPTVLVYGHYDVQPVDPIDEWESDPFVPTVRGENLYARGASDMKGSLVALLKAVEALIKTGGLPVNLKFLLEGEEEVGSPSLPAFIPSNRERLAATVALNCDGDLYGPDQPSICYALRGLAYFEIEVHGPKQDLHSGVFGGSLHNPAQALCELIAGMHDADGRITLPGFYNAVRDLDADERAALARSAVPDDQWIAMSGVPALAGEKGFSTVERVGARPSLDVNGIVGGFTGEGAKTVLPAKALAKISMRLVADQKPEDVHRQLVAYIEQHAPDTITWEVRGLGSAPAAIVDRDSPEMRAALEALADTFGSEPFFKREGGSIPVVGLMQEQLGLESILMGCRLPDDNMHGPNEKQHLPTLYKGVEAFVRFLVNLGEMG